MTERQFKTTPQHQPDKTTPNISNTQANSSDLVQLQRYLGNQGVQRLLAKGNGTRIQAKLSVNAPGDQFEVEADKVSKEVARMPYGVQRESEGGEAEEEEMQLKRASDIQREDEGGEMEEEEMQLKRAEGSIQREDEGGEMEEEEMQLKRAEGSIQREDEGGEMEEEEMQLQRASSEMDGGFEVGGEIESTIQAQRGGGQAMGEQTRGFFESGMGHDFSNVKVHDDSTADQLNQSVSARAFTIGSDIFFRGGEYQPESQSGRELMAHELTHVVQQGGASVKKDDGQ